VRGLTVVLANGWVVQVERGEVIASADGWFNIVCGRDTLRVPVRALPWPDVPKCSAGYALRDRMDLVDLLVGSEGTLGIITEITFGMRARDQATCLAFVSVADEGAAIDLVGVLRDQAHASWATHGQRGVDVSAIEHVDRRSIELLREDGADRRSGVTLPASAATILFIEMELNDVPTQAEAWAQVAGACEASAPDTPLVRFCRLLSERGLLDDAELALPGDERRVASFRALREAVPETVNNRIAKAKRSEPRASKIAADVIVPFEQFDAMLSACHAAFHRRSLDAAIWGHISDGNVHPNVIPRNAADLASGPEAILEIGREVIRLGGSPLAEHGVGRNAVKKTLLKLLHGDAGLGAMRMVKQALDPAGILAPGVLF
jgi:D-lactate dehydrogenase (cytochrome)